MRSTSQRTTSSLWRGCSLLLLASSAASGVALWWLDVRISSEHSWILIVLMIAAVVLGAAGLGALVLAIRSMLASRAPETIVEVDDAELTPGSRLRVYVEQMGPMVVNHLMVVLVCRETERIDTRWDVLETDVSTDRERLVTRSDHASVDTPMETNLIDESGLVIDSKVPFGRTVDLIIPDDALPTGTSTRTETLTADQMGSHVPSDARNIRRTISTEVVWQIVVTGDVQGRVDFRHEFPVVVRPRQTFPSRSAPARTSPRAPAPGSGKIGGSGR